MNLYAATGVLCLVFFQTTVAAGCKDNNVEQLARDFFVSHQQFYVQDSPAVKPLLTPAFYRVLQAEYQCVSQGEVCAIAADPWLSAQDGDIAAPVLVRITNQTALNATVSLDYQVVLASNQQQRQVVLEFEKTTADACWLLSDFKTAKEGSLKKQLQQWQKEHGAKPKLSRQT